MIAAVDVDYRDPSAVAALVLFSDWTDPAPARELTATVSAVKPYQPGMFFEREMPCIEAALRAAGVTPDALVVDGYAWLAPGRPGLGAHVHQALGGAVPVVGVAKTPFASAAGAVPVLRGQSRRPLWVSAAGIDVNAAAAAVRSMHGPYRVPTLLQRVDRLCRDAP